PLTGDAIRRAATIYQEAYLRERDLHGTLSEGYMRDLVRAFAGQRVPGRRLGSAAPHVALPRVTVVERIVADDARGEIFGRPSEIELDLAFGSDPVWLGEIRRRRRPVDVADVELVARKAAF